MTKELLLAAYLIGVGLCVAGAGTHLYQALSRQPALLRFDGATVAHMAGNLVMSFLCGPYIMLQMGWRQEAGGAIAVGPALVSALVAFGWAFLTGLLLVGTYVAIRY